MGLQQWHWPQGEGERLLFRFRFHARDPEKNGLGFISSGFQSPPSGLKANFDIFLLTDRSVQIE